MLKRFVKDSVKNIVSGYISAGYPLLPVTKYLRTPMRWFYHQSPLLRHDSDFYIKPFLLNFLHSLFILEHPQDFKIYQNQIKFRSFGSLMSVQGYYVGEIEYHLLKYVVSQIRPGFTMLDIGAHHGLYPLVLGYELKNRGWEGVIHSFEPNPQNYSLLEYNVKQNDLSDYTVLYNQAVSNTIGKQNLLIYPSENSGCLLSSVREIQDINSREQLIEQEVDTIALNELHDCFCHVNLIKMDIQGAELFALLGAEKIIVRDRPLLVVEATQQWPSTQQIASFLKKHNYSIFGVDATGKLCDIDSPEVFVSWDWVAVPC